MHIQPVAPDVAFEPWRLFELELIKEFPLLAARQKWAGDLGIERAPETAVKVARTQLGGVIHFQVSFRACHGKPGQVPDEVGEDERGLHRIKRGLLIRSRTQFEISSNVQS